jgi:uncharacterized delta-60 repeat protein
MMEMCGWYIFKMSQKVKVGGVWKDAGPYLKVGGSWKVPQAIYNKVNGEWKNSFLAGGLNDSSFTTYDVYNGFNGIANSGIVQSNGKFIIVGEFTTFNGATVNGVVRLNSDGTRDTAFTTNTGTGGYYPLSLAVQSDNKILIGGIFTTWNGTTVNRIVRLNSDGTRDTAFTDNVGTGANGTVFSIKLQSDGKILVGGNFTTWNSVAVKYAVRLNSDGTRDTTFTTNMGTGPDALVNEVLVQPDGKIVMGGNFTTWNGTSVKAIVRLNSDGTREASFTTNTGSFEIAAIYDIAIQSDQKLIIGGSFTNWNGVAVNNIVRLNSDGTRDTTFTTNTGTAASGYEIYSVTVQSDGKILLGGNFVYWNGTAVYRIVRLNSDGTRDTTFTTNAGTAGNDYINEILLMSDQTIVVLGAFTTWNGTTLNRIVKLNSDGTRLSENVGTTSNGDIRKILTTLDNKIIVCGSFTTWNYESINRVILLELDGTVNNVFKNNIGTGANSDVVHISKQSDGKFILVGNFATWNGTTVNRIVRLNSDGTRDTTFTTNTGTAANSAIYSSSVQSDGKIIIAGDFTSWNGTTVGRVVRLNSDGTRDTTFTTNTGTGASSWILHTAIQPDGKILLGGNFTTWNGVTANRIVSINSDGTLDTTFNSNTSTSANNAVYSSIAIQPDGKILLGGFFTTWGGVTVNRIVRLNSDGTRDTTFTTNTGTAANNTVYSLDVQSDGKIVIGGNFTTWNGITTNYIVRLNSDGTRDTGFSINDGIAFNNAVWDSEIQSDGKMLVGGSFLGFNNVNRTRIARIGGDFAG